jgi:hypothetical protein
VRAWVKIPLFLGLTWIFGIRKGEGQGLTLPRFCSHDIRRKTFRRKLMKKKKKTLFRRRNFRRFCD